MPESGGDPDDGPSALRRTLILERQSVSADPAERGGGPEDLVPVRVPASGASQAADFTGTARRSADAAVAQLLAVAPSLFDCVVPGASLADAYRAWLTYKFLQKDVVNGPEEAAPADQLVARTAPPPPSDALLDVAATWRADDGSRPDPKKKIAGGAAFVVGTPGEAAWMGRVAAALPRSVKAMMILKKKRGALQAAVAAQAGSRFAVGSWPDLARGGLHSGEHQRVTAVLRQLVDALARPENEALRPHGEWVVTFVATAVSALGLKRQFEPALVVGSLEKSPIGLVLSALSPALCIRTFSIQHGNIAKQQVLDLVRFDCFGVWHEHTHRTLAADGYPADARVVVVGSPPAPPAGEAEQKEFARLKAWAAGRRVLVLFMQPAKPPFVSPDMLHRLLRLMLHAAGRGERDVLLVKPHPSNKPEEVAAWRNEAAGNPAVGFLPSGRESMETALKLCDVAISLSSTALVDAATAGKAAAAFDPAGYIRGSQMYLPEEVRVTCDDGELRSFLAAQGRASDAAAHRIDFVSAVAGRVTSLASA